MGLGSLIDASGQNQLTSLQQNISTFGGSVQQQEASTQAAALQQEANSAFMTGAVNAERDELQGKIAEGKQAQTYSQSGVELTGSPMAMLNQTNMLAQQQASMSMQQGILQQNVLDAQAAQAQDQGLAAVMEAQGSNLVAGQENQINQFQEASQVIQSLLTGGLGFGRGLIGELMQPAPAAPFIPTP